jgi:Pvc16 N-terminal domain
MSNHIAIAAVTTTLMNMIQTQVSADPVVAGGKVTAFPPDVARTNNTGNQLNLFLYRTSIDAAWRNMDPPSIRPGEVGQPPLPLVLSYLVTAYGDSDQEILGHRMLGIAMSVLNDQPVLSRAAISEIQSPEASGSGLDQQVELIKLIPDPRPLDEISRMWTTFGTGYRLSVSYDAAVLLIDSTTTASAPLPVLMRGAGDTGPSVVASLAPQIDLVTPPGAQVSARPGDTVALAGRNLAVATGIQVTGIRVTQPTVLTPTLNQTTGDLTFQIPAPATIPAGMVAIAPTYGDGSGGTIPGTAVPLALAPTITSSKALKAKLDAQGGATVKVTCAPDVQPGQTVALIVGSQIVPGASPASATNSLSFTLTGLTKGTTYPLRLRIDSVDSIPVAGPPPTVTNPYVPDPISFDPSQTLVTS